MRIRRARVLPVFVGVVFLFLGYTFGRITSYSANCRASLSTDPAENIRAVAENIYNDAVLESAKLFSENGGIMDNKQISAGHGSKIRIWDYYAPHYNCPTKERIGNVGDGGKWLCGVRTWLKDKVSNCVIYSFGSKGEVSFEKAAKYKLPHCELHVFDPTLTVHQKLQVESVRNITFHDYGIAAQDGFLHIDARRKLSWVQKTKTAYPVKSLRTIMSDLGHTRIDVLKVDIEGGEWSVFEALFSEFELLPSTQILIELHFLGSVEQVISFFTNAFRHKYRAFSSEPNYYGRSAENARNMIEYSFLQMSSKLLR